MLSENGKGMGGVGEVEGLGGFCGCLIRKFKGEAVTGVSR